MKASAEELLLLLKKWESDKIVVSAIGSTQPADGFRMAFKVSGLVAVDWAAATFGIGSLGEDIVLCHVSYGDASYLQRGEMSEDVIKGMMVDPEQIEEIIFMRNADLSTLVLFTLIEN